MIRQLFLWSLAASVASLTAQAQQPEPVRIHIVALRAVIPKTVLPDSLAIITNADSIVATGAARALMAKASPLSSVYTCKTKLPNSCSLRPGVRWAVEVFRPRAEGGKLIMEVWTLHSVENGPQPVHVRKQLVTLERRNGEWTVTKVDVAFTT